VSPGLPSLPSLSSFTNQLENFQTGLQQSGMPLGSLLSSAPASSNAPATVQSAGLNLGSMVGGAAGAVASTLFGISITRLVTGILGLLAIAGAIYLFKGPEVLEGVKKAAGTSAEVAAA